MRIGRSRVSYVYIFAGINFELEEGRGSVDASTGEYTPMKWVPCNDEV